MSKPKQEDLKFVISMLKEFHCQGLERVVEYERQERADLSVPVLMQCDAIKSVKAFLEEQITNEK